MKQQVTSRPKSSEKSDGTTITPTPDRSNMATQTMEAIKIASVGKAEIRTVPMPKLRDDYILVKVSAVALNPTDW